MKSKSKHLYKLIGRSGEFEHVSRHVMCQCVVRGVACGDLLIIDYVTPDGEKIEGAFILRHEFIPDGGQ